MVSGAVAAALIGGVVGLLGFLYRQAIEQARMRERIEWLCTRYAADHDDAVPWDDPRPDGGDDRTLVPDGGRRSDVLGRVLKVGPDPLDGVIDVPATESGSSYNGVLSHAGEWHAVAVGALAGAVWAATGDPAVASALGTVVYGAGKLGSSHLRDARQEVAYTAGGAVVGVGAVEWVVPAVRALLTVVGV